MTEGRTATEKLYAELHGLGVTSAYEVGDDATVSVWIGLVVHYRDGFYRWQEGRGETSAFGYGSGRLRYTSGASLHRTAGGYPTVVGGPGQGVAG